MLDWADGLSFKSMKATVEQKHQETLATLKAQHKAQQVLLWVWVWVWDSRIGILGLGFWDSRIGILGLG